MSKVIDFDPNKDPKAKKGYIEIISWDWAVYDGYRFKLFPSRAKATSHVNGYSLKREQIIFRWMDNQWINVYHKVPGVHRKVTPNCQLCNKPITDKSKFQWIEDDYGYLSYLCIHHYKKECKWKYASSD
jgi:hypothetical protein